MDNENPKFQIQGCQTGRLIIPQYDTTGHLFNQPDPDTLCVDIAEGYQLDVGFAKDFIPKTERAIHVIKFLQRLKDDRQSKELCLMPIKLAYNNKTKALRLTWPAYPNQWCIIKDYAFGTFPNNLGFTMCGGNIKTFGINLGDQ